MEKISEGEPVLKKSRKGFIPQDSDPPLVKYIPKKPKLVPPLEGYAPCGLSVQFWFNLILSPFVSLVELIKIKRTCKMFATHKGVKRLILDKEYSAFRHIPDRFKNKMDREKGYETYIMPYIPGLFTIRVTETFYGWEGREEYTLVGVFSSKERLWNQFIEELDGNVFHEYSYSMRKNENDMIIINAIRRPSRRNDYAEITVQGINEDIISWIKSL